MSSSVPVIKPVVKADLGTSPFRDTPNDRVPSSSNHGSSSRQKEHEANPIARPVSKNTQKDAAPAKNVA